jgi:hypothetical protein
MSWREEDGNYLLHLRLRGRCSRRGFPRNGMQAVEVLVELRDGRVFRLDQDGSREFVQFALQNPDLNAQAARLQELSLPELVGGTNTELFNFMRSLVRAGGAI